MRHIYDRGTTVITERVLPGEMRLASSLPLPAATAVVTPEGTRLAAASFTDRQTCCWGSNVRQHSLRVWIVTWFWSGTYPGGMGGERNTLYRPVKQNTCKRKKCDATPSARIQPSKPKILGNIAQTFLLKSACPTSHLPRQTRQNSGKTRTVLPPSFQLNLGTCSAFVNGWDEPTI